MNQVNRSAAVAVAVAVAIMLSGYLFFQAAGQRYLAGVAPPPARDALVQSLDLARIAGFRHVDDHTLELVDEGGRKFSMELTQACPGLKTATDFSLVTESYRSFERFTAIAVHGAVCTIKDFSPLIETTARSAAP